MTYYILICRSSLVRQKRQNTWQNMVPCVMITEKYAELLKISLLF